jgi:SAM-dependent methyltransferase
MTKYSEKVTSGKTLTDEDWIEYLNERHSKHSGLTQFVFGSYKTTLGPSSYELMIQELKAYKDKAVTVLDLACGDGFLTEMCLPEIHAQSKLIGIDMVPEEIESAKHRVNHTQVAFRCETAQNMTLPNESVDVVLSHLALMLMLPLDPVVDEIYRVLKPGGKLVAIINGPKLDKMSQGGMYQMFGGKITDLIEAELGKKSQFTTGDPRFAQSDGVQTVFTEAKGFSPPHIEDFNLLMKDTPEKLIEIIKTFYIFHMVPKSLQSKLLIEVSILFKEKRDSDGTTLFECPFRKFVVSKNK